MYFKYVISRCSTSNRTVPRDLSQKQKVVEALNFVGMFLVARERGIAIFRLKRQVSNQIY